MDLRGKLARLRERTGAAPPVPAVAHALEGAVGEGVGDGDPTPDPTGDAAAASVPPHIEALRSRLAELLDRTRGRATEKQRVREAERAERAASVEHEPLPFESIDTPCGPLHVRAVAHGAQARVGRCTLSGACDVAGESLALLALDPSLGVVDPARALYLDTESTGLAGGTGTVPFLVGLGWFEGRTFVVEQLLLRQLGEEAPILARLAERIAAASMLVSFNGKSFDLPLLRTRYVMNRVPPPREPPHLDLVHLARRIHRGPRGGVRAPRIDRGGPWIELGGDDGVARAPSCKLVALERSLLGFDRVDDVPSAEIPAIYGHFLRTGDSAAIHAVCDHNLWDVLSMAALVGTYATAVRALDEAVDDATPGLFGRDLVGVATTLHRAGDQRRARIAATRAIDDGGGDSELDLLARRVRAAAAKRARDLDGAVDDLHTLATSHDDPGARLELAKIYEHRLHDPQRALGHVENGTGEPTPALDRRRARLQKKADRALPQLQLSGRSGAQKLGKTGPG